MYTHARARARVRLTRFTLENKNQFNVDGDMNHITDANTSMGVQEDILRELLVLVRGVTATHSKDRDRMRRVERVYAALTNEIDEGLQSLYSMHQHTSPWGKANANAVALDELPIDYLLGTLDVVNTQNARVRTSDTSTNRTTTTYASPYALSALSAAPGSEQTVGVDAPLRGSNGDVKCVANNLVGRIGGNGVHYLSLAIKGLRHVSAINPGTYDASYV